MRLTEQELADLAEYYRPYLDELSRREFIQADLVGLRQVCLAAIAQAARLGMIHLAADELLGRIMAELPKLAETLTLAEAAARYRIEHATLRRACYDRRLRAEKRAKTWFVEAADIEEFLRGFSPRPRGYDGMDNPKSSPNLHQIFTENG